MAKLTYQTLTNEATVPSSKFTLAYLAGMIDGDGCFVISKQRRKDSHHKSILYNPKLTVSNIDFRLIEWIVRNFGGNWKVCKNRINALPNRKPLYTWELTGHKACELARHIMQFLVIKQLQAYLFSCFEYEALWVRGGAPSDIKVPNEELGRRELLYQQVKACNHRSTDGEIVNNANIHL